MTTSRLFRYLEATRRRHRKRQGVPARCPQCGTRLARSPRRGLFERAVLAPLPFIRPYACPECQYRGVLFTETIDGKRIFLFFVSIVLGALIVQLIWWLRTGAPDHPGLGYEPHDLERQQYLEQKEKR